MDWIKIRFGVGRFKEAPMWVKIQRNGFVLPEALEESWSGDLRV